MHFEIACSQNTRFEAKENTLSIVFVDEIDEIGRQTGLLLERRDSYLHEAEYPATTKS